MARLCLDKEQAAERVAHRAGISTSMAKQGLATLTPIQSGGQVLYSKADLKALADRLKAGGDRSFIHDRQPPSNECTIPFEAGR